MLKIIDSIPSIEKKVNKSLAEIFNSYLRKQESSIQKNCKSLIAGWILSQPEIISLNSYMAGSLAGQFGLRPGDASAATKKIIQSIEDSVTVEFKNLTNNLSGGVFVYFQPTNFLNILGIREGHVRYAAGDLHWLKWLILEGDRIIVANYRYNPESGLGRSGAGNMIVGGYFRVPPEFSGTADNNFITRALIGPEQEKAITNIFIQELR